MQTLPETPAEPLGSYLHVTVSFRSRSHARPRSGGAAAEEGVPALPPSPPGLLGKDSRQVREHGGAGQRKARALSPRLNTPWSWTQESREGQGSGLWREPSSREAPASESLRFHLEPHQTSITPRLRV